MGIRVAHGEKDNIQSAILSGAIPKDSIIFTSDNEETTEIFFYDALGSLKSVAPGSGSGTEELRTLAEKVAANAVAIETESKQRSDADAGIMALINQLAGNHTADIEGLRSADAALQDEIDALETEVTKKANAADLVDYSVTVAESSPEGYAKTYTFSQKGAEIVTINIPKDMVVESGSVVVDPEGHPAGTYIKLVLANAVEDELFIDVGDLIEYVTSGSVAGDQIMVAVSADHKVTATLSAGSVTLAQLHADVQAEINKAHEHANKAVLDGITQNMADAWNTADTGYTEAEVTAMWNEVFGA